LHDKHVAKAEARHAGIKEEHNGKISAARLELKDALAASGVATTASRACVSQATVLRDDVVWEQDLLQQTVEATGVAALSTAETHELLTMLQFTAHSASHLHQHGITAADILEMADADLKSELNLPAYGDRKRLRRSLELLGNGSGVGDVAPAAAAGSGGHPAFGWTTAQVVAWAEGNGLAFLVSWLNLEKVDGAVLLEEIDPRDVDGINFRDRATFTRKLKVLRGEAFADVATSPERISQSASTSNLRLVFETVVSANSEIQKKLDAIKKKYATIKVDQQYIGPITLVVMEDPVFASDGHTYERTAIQQWIDGGNRTSPLQGAAVRISRRLTPNHAMRSAIRELTEATCA
jgi:hypothetical protein